MRTALPLVASLVCLAALAGSAPARAEAPQILPVQGTLYDAEGVPIHDALPVEFTLYADPDGAIPLWSDVMTVDFVDGTFTAYLGDGDPINLVLFRDYAQVFVGLAIDGDEEMPLFGLATAPYAGYAAYAGDAATVGGLTADDIAANALIDARAEFAPLGHRTAWSSIDGIPAGFADGVDNDTVLSEADVDAFVADNGFITSIVWSAISGIPAGFADGVDNDTDTVLSEAQVDAYVSNNRFPWSSIDGIPAGFLDGVDNDTDTVLSETQVDAYVANNGFITGVGVTPGLLGGGSTGDVTLSPDTTWLQRRVVGSCPAGTAIRAIAEDGTLTCETVVRIACNRTGWVYGDQGCGDDILITCVGGFVTEIRFAC